MSPRKAVSPEKRRGYSGHKITPFCKNVRARREGLHLTQEQLAAKMRTFSVRISEIEGGTFPRDPERIIALASALDCSIDDLFGAMASKPVMHKAPAPAGAVLPELRAMFQKLSLQLADNLACAEADERWRGTVLQYWGEVLTILEGLGPSDEQSGQQLKA